MASTDPSVTTIGAYEVSGLPSADGGTYLGRRVTGGVRGRLYRLHVVRLSEASAHDLRREVELSTRIKHPASSPVVDFFPWEQRHVLVFDHVDGIQLSRLLRYLERDGERLPDGAIWYLGLQAVGALARAHGATDPSGKAAPIVHGCFGPEHVLVSWDGRVVLVGLGLPTLLEATSASPSADASPVSFAAPELGKGQPATPAADSYSVSLLLWTLLAGRWPPKGRERVPLVREVRDDVPDTIAAAIDLSLEPSPGLRKIRCVDLERELRRVANVAVGKAELRDAVEMIRALLGLWSVVPPPAAAMAQGAAKLSGRPSAAPRPTPSTRPSRSTASTPQRPSPSTPEGSARRTPTAPPALPSRSAPDPSPRGPSRSVGSAAAAGASPSADAPVRGSAPEVARVKADAGAPPPKRALPPGRSSVDELDPPASLSDLTATDVPASPPANPPATSVSHGASLERALPVSDAATAIDVALERHPGRDSTAGRASADPAVERSPIPTRSQSSPAAAPTAASQSSPAPAPTAPSQSSPAPAPTAPAASPHGGSGQATGPDASSPPEASRAVLQREPLPGPVDVPPAAVPEAAAPGASAPSAEAGRVPSAADAAASTAKQEASIGAPRSARMSRRMLVPALLAPVALAAGLWVAWDAGLLAPGAAPTDAPVPASAASSFATEPTATATPHASATREPGAPTAALPETSATPGPDASGSSTPDAASASAGGAAASAGAASGGGDGSELLSYEGYLFVRSTAQAEVFVQGKHVGPTNTRLVARCHQKFIRLGTLPGPQWLSDGVGVRIACRSVTEVTIEPSR